MSQEPRLRRREPAMVFILSVLTLGLYVPFWYHNVYQELESLNGKTPTGHGFWLDFLLTLITCFIYGIWVDYQISTQLYEFEKSQDFEDATDTSIVNVILDIAAYGTVFITRFITCAIHQDQLNKVSDQLEKRIPAGLPA